MEKQEPESQRAVERQYTGQVSDQDATGLYYYNARYYSPQTALFTQADTAADDLNRYSYTGGNPVKFSDPSGYSKYSDALEDRLSEAKLARLLDFEEAPYTDASYHIPWYNNLSIYPEDPRFEHRYEAYISRARVVQKTSLNFLDMIEKVNSYIYGSSSYSKRLIDAWNLKNDLRKQVSRWELISEKRWESLNASSQESPVLDKLYLLADSHYRISLLNLEMGHKREQRAWAYMYKNNELINALSKNTLVCGGFALAGQYTFHELGVHTMYQTVFFHFDGGEIFYHANLRAYIGKQWYIIDPTWNLVILLDDYQKYLERWFNIEGSIEYDYIETGLE